MLNRITRRALLPYALVTPALLAVAGVSLYPALYNLYLSFHRTQRGELVYNGLHNYQTILASPTFWNAVRLTATFAAFFVPLVLVGGYLLALVFYSGVRFGRFYMTLIFIPWMLSEIVAGVMWRWLFLPGVGIVQTWLDPIAANILGTGTGAMTVVICATVWRALAFGMLLLLAGLQTIPQEIHEAAAIDGATRWQAFWHVTVPLMAPTHQVTLAFLTVQAMNTTGMFLSITEGGPGRSTEVLALHMYRESIQFFNFGYGATLAVTVFVVTAFVISTVVSGLHTRALFD